MSYEAFRASFHAQLLPVYSPDVLERILASLDIVANDYDIQRRTMDLIVYNDVPETVKLYIASKAVENTSKGTLDNYYRALCAFFRTVCKPVEQITTNDVRVYLHQYKLSHHVQDSTLEGLRITLNSFFAWCLDEDLVQKNPIHRIKPIKFQQKPRQPMTPMELELMRSACRTVREKALVDFLYSTAARVSEAAALKLEDVDLKEGTIQIQHGKGDKARPSYLNAEAIVSLQAYLATRDDDCPAVFVTTRRPHHQMTAKALQEEIKAIKTRANIQKKVTPHVFRHTTATTALRNGMSVQQVMQLLGHSRLDTTLIYTHEDNSDVKASHARHVP